MNMYEPLRSLSVQSLKRTSQASGLCLFSHVPGAGDAFSQREPPTGENGRSDARLGDGAWPGLVAGLTSCSTVGELEIGLPGWLAKVGEWLV